MTDDLNCCFHEAAHAVAAKLLGLRVAHATVHPDRPHVKTLHRSDDLDASQKLAIVDLAPTIIEPNAGCLAIDERNAFSRAQRIAMDEWHFDEGFNGLPEATAKVQDELRDFAHRLIRNNMPAVERVANALARKGRLTESEIDALMPEAAR